MENKDHLDLWKYFQDHADHIKERLWTLTAWLLALLTGLLGFITKNGMQFGADRIVDGQVKPFVTDPVLVCVLSILGLILCGYMYLLQDAYGNHILSNWEKANRILAKYPDLKEIVLGDQKLKPTPVYVKDAVYLIRLTSSFGGIFIIVIIVSLLNF
ncbi:MAG: hypothetical protein DHS20C18_48730 [Saprospiraceae bacterium]|nr:MAG: hypothetical protein DHS20C18_48730 [Saprospiraceae bacterium]